MTITEAKRICREYYELTNPSEDETFIFTEALQYLIDRTKDPAYMLDLCGYYYEKRQFDLALKYYELAAEYDFLPAKVKDIERRGSFTKIGIGIYLVDF